MPEARLIRDALSKLNEKVTFVDNHPCPTGVNLVSTVDKRDQLIISSIFVISHKR